MNTSCSWSEIVINNLINRYRATSFMSRHRHCSNSSTFTETLQTWMNDRARMEMEEARFLQPSDECCSQIILRTWKPFFMPMFFLRVVISTMNVKCGNLSEFSQITKECHVVWFIGRTGSGVRVF